MHLSVQFILTCIQSQYLRLTYSPFIINPHTALWSTKCLASKHNQREQMAKLPKQHLRSQNLAWPFWRGSRGITNTVIRSHAPLVSTTATGQNCETQHGCYGVSDHTGNLYALYLRSCPAFQKLLEQNLHSLHCDTLIKIWHGRFTKPPYRGLSHHLKGDVRMTAGP